MKTTKDEAEQLLCHQTILQGRGSAKHMLTNALCDLVEYKRIEEELGIDLITLVTALKDGCYYKDGTPKFGYHVNHTKVYAEYFHYNKELVFVYELGNLEWFLYPKDYGRTWALTKEELEESDEERKNLKRKGNRYERQV